LSRFLSFLLLQGKPRPSVKFPRRQHGKDKDGLATLQRMCRRDRWEFSHSVASLRRNLPRSCTLHTPSVRSAWEANAFSNPPPPPQEYLTFLRKEVSRLFPLGWDRRYDEFVYHHVPNASSRMNGSRADLLWAGRWKEFRRNCLFGLPADKPLEARYKEVLSAGKNRPLLIYHENVDLLGPLHKTIYSFLQSKDWLLCGPPTEGRVSSVCNGRFQTSVDLVNATDNLSLVGTEAILGTLLRKAVRVPGTIKCLAFDSLHPLVDMGGGARSEVTNGQMMGSYLSFPLLCLHSYLAALWATRRMDGVNILVNGDDTLISSPLPVLSEDYPPGYILNDKKTIRAENVAEINSTAFLRTRGKWREVRHLRRGSFLTDFPGMLHAAAATRGSVVWTDAFVRSRIGKKWGFLPSQLGLHSKSYPSYCRTRDMAPRYFTALPTRLSSNVPGLSATRRVADPDERLATVAHLFKYGRGEGRKRDVFSPSIGEVRRSYGRMRFAPYSVVSYRGKLASLKVASGEESDVLVFIPDDYTSLREDRAARAYDEFRRDFDSSLVEQ
jgi:hypothetical protein